MIPSTCSLKLDCVPQCKKNVSVSVSIVCIGVSTPFQKHHPFFLPSPLFNLEIVQAPLLKQFPPIYWFFMNPSKNRIFQ